MASLKSQAQAILIGARLLLSDKANWTKGKAARVAGGGSVAPPHPKAVCWCSIGALGAAQPANYSAYILARNTLDTVNDEKGGTVAFNDHYKTTHAGVLRAFDKAIAQLEA